MRHSVFSLLLGAISLITTTGVTGLEFTVSLEENGKAADASKLQFVKIPPLKHRRRGHRNTTVATGQHVTAKRGNNDISYSDNWCGASSRSNDADPIRNVFGYFTVPDLKLRAGIPPPQYAAAWIGIDGAKCNQTLLQAGVTTVVNSNGGQSASAWWEWYPGAAYTIANLPVKPGDWMSVNITAHDATSGRIIVTNAQRGYSMTLNLTSGPKLCRWDVEWILEDFYEAETNKQVPFASFQDLWFLDTEATTVRGKNVGIDGAAMVHLMNPQGKVLCQAEKYDNANFVITSN
ncbi:hypothetical protein QC763_105370 [Podospora pseudopauciseta]|uniref:Concanavalin A-like lectin/glucanase n=1 Tax=Podospora pseudopauciseta TaxID=2093780 RepID=A0ABR0HYC4_9PEZI|nr:hypothetical protein QC763_105370 [Podospora pseudopauciseta]